MRGWTLVIGMALLAPVLAGCMGPGPTSLDAAAPETSAVALEITLKVVSEEDRRVHASARFSDGLVPDEASWDWGDSTSRLGNPAVHVYPSDGTYRITVQAIHPDEGLTEVKENLTLGTPTQQAPPPEGVPVEPTPTASPEPGPTAEPDPVPLAEAPFRIEVEGTLASIVASKPFSLVKVDWGDGTVDQALTHAYSENGVYTIAVEYLTETTHAFTTASAEVLEFRPRVVVGLTDTGINPYHEIYYRPYATAHPCTYVQGYGDCSVPALELSVGPEGGTYNERVSADADAWDKVRPGQWFWIPRTNLIGVHCPEGDSTQGGICILDDESTHGTGTSSNVLTEVPDALIVFNDGSSSAQLATSPVPIDIESNSWGSLAPLYGGLVNGPTGQQVCHDDIDDPVSIKFRSAGNNGPVPNMGDCWRNGFRTYSVSGGYPDGSHGELSGSAPDFASYWCRPVASAQSLDGWGDSCGTSFAAPTAAGTAAGALLEIRRELGYTGPSTTAEVAPGLSHDAFMDAVIMAATYDPSPRDGMPSGGLTAPATSQTPWYWWGWGWLHAEQIPAIVDCAMDRPCPDNKSEEAWTFNDLRRSFASDGDP